MSPLTWASTWWRARYRPATTPGEGSPTVRLLLPGPQQPSPVHLTPETELPPIPAEFKQQAPEQALAPSTKPMIDPELAIRDRLIAADAHPFGGPR